MTPRLLELLADKAAGQLDPEDIPELGRLLEAHPEVDPHELDRIVQDLRAGLERTRPRTGMPRLLHRLGWVEWAVAAIVLIAVGVAVRFAVTPSEQDRLAAARLTLEQQDSQAIMWPWVPLEGATRPPIRGDVIWSQREQRGFLRFEALAENIPPRARYHLLVEQASGEIITVHTFDAKKRPGDWIVAFDAALADPPVGFQVTHESTGPTGVQRRTVASTRP